MGYEYSSRSFDPEPVLKSARGIECWLPGFVRQEATFKEDVEFRGQCTICHEDTLLALLIQRPSAGLGSTTNLPRELISSYICCTECASYLVPPANLLDQPIVGALALVSVVNNEEAWLKALSTLRARGSGRDWLLEWFGASLEAETNQTFVAALEEKSLYRKALECFKTDVRKWLEQA